jgi:hypothetical protein
LRKRNAGCGLLPWGTNWRSFTGKERKWNAGLVV